ncbi:uncharacterized protein LOC121871866 [Homarus americanus]|uniref:Uncharacterized protein n=1 Tax=Homarus americanus TaxID=6706 RepID=A0A8J5JUP5_HOMAM|nr:uncharacterized protein LOC121871866 [Homarus americanus]KAG7164487.1 hypothetical protein Hamer_G003697 [Homarus americanus]
MGCARAVVAVVLSIISLAVLSLHVALCVHYPSPLFAVTLLLNPSLWMFLGAAGMGCALALTYRERQRKVRAGLCTTCHARYGATIDSKWRSPEVQWRESLHSQRGPSRAIYSYNGNSHKFYASYGTINEKQAMEMKRGPLTTAANQVSKDTKRRKEITTLNCVRKPPTNFEQTKEKSGGSNNINKIKDPDAKDAGNFKEELDLKTNGEDIISNSKEQIPKIMGNNGPHGTTGTLPGKDGEISRVISQLPDTHGGKQQQCKNINSSVLPLIEAKTTLEVNGNSVSSSCGADTDSRTSSSSLGKQVSCDCLARYATMDYKRRQHLYRATADSRSPRRQQYSHSEIRTVGRYHKKLLMHCRLKDPRDVPVELFAARNNVDVDNSDNSTDQNVASKRIVLAGEDSGPPVHQGSSHTKATIIDGESHLPHADDKVTDAQDRFRNSSETEMTQGKYEDSEPISSETKLFTLRKVKNKDSHYTPTTRLLPVKHSPPSPIQTPTTTQWSTASPTFVNFESLPQHDDPQDLSLESTQEPSQDCDQSHDAQCRDLDVASVSSESGLLPSSNKTSLVGRDFLKSPLWRSFRGAKKEHKPAVDDDSEEHNQGHHDHDSVETQLESSKSQQRPGQHRLKSLFSSSRRVLAKPKRTRSSGGSERRAPWRPSPSVSTSVRETTDSTTTPREKLTFTVRKTTKNVVSSIPRKNMTKPVSPLSSSPARVVKSLVMRNIHRTTGKSRDACSHYQIPDTAISSDNEYPSDTGDPRVPQEVSTPPLSTSPASTSSSPCPSVRPKERKKQKTRLKNKHRAGSTDSVLLLSDDTTE